MRGKQVLSFPPGHGAELYGVRRTLVIAAQARRALSFPHRFAFRHPDVAGRTPAFAPCAARAMLVGVKRFVGHQKTQEQRTEHIALQPRETAPVHIVTLRPSVSNGSDDDSQSGRKGLQLAANQLLGIGVESGQADVGVGHGDRESGRHVPPFGADGFPEDGQRMPHVVATRAYHVAVRVFLSFYGQSA